MLYADGQRLIFQYDGQTLYVEPWGNNAFRVRASRLGEMPSEGWALDVPPTESQATIETVEGEYATIWNGSIKAVVSKRGKITMFKATGEKILEEYARHRLDLTDPKCSALEIEARQFRPIPGGGYHTTMRLESLEADEKIYGMGQYQQPYLNLKGTDIEMAQRNSQASVPFMVSSLGYGLLWNNPGIGRAVLGRNVMSFENYSSNIIDYWIVVGTTPGDIVEAYGKATGYVPMMPEYGLGFWQCKLRYDNQEQLLDIAREYRKRKVPLDLIVIDFFHWKWQGDWSFDPEYVSTNRC